MHKVHEVLFARTESLTSLIMAYIFTSSANNLTMRPEPKMSSISLINNRKRTRPKTNMFHILFLRCLYSPIGLISTVSLLTKICCLSFTHFGIIHSHLIGSILHFG